MATIKEWRKNLKDIVNRRYTIDELDALKRVKTNVVSSIGIMYDRHDDRRTIRAIENDYDKLAHIIEMLERQRPPEVPVPLPDIPFYDYAITAMIDILYVDVNVPIPENPTYADYIQVNKTERGWKKDTVSFKYKSAAPNYPPIINTNDSRLKHIIDTMLNNSLELLLLNEDSQQKIFMILLQKTKEGRIKMLQIHRREDINDYDVYTNVRLHGQFLQYEGLKEEVTDKECGKVLLEYSGLSTYGINLDNGISLEELEQLIHYTQTPAIILNLFDEPIITFKKGDKVNQDFSKIQNLISPTYPRPKRIKMMIAKVANGHLYNITDEKQRHRYQHPDHTGDQIKDTREVKILDDCGLSTCDCCERLDLSNMKGLYSTKCDLRPLYDRCLNNNFIPKIYETRNTIHQITINGVTIYHDRKRDITKTLLDLYNEIYGLDEQFKNQSFMSVLKMFLPLFQSVTNEQTAQIFENNISSGGFYFQEEHNNLSGLDINAAYPTIMKNDVLPVFDGSETIGPFTGTINPRSIYYINPKTNNLMCQQGYFYGCAVQEFIESNFITLQDILDEINPASSTNEICNLMKVFEERVTDRRLLKEIRCNISGLLGQLDTQTKVARTTSLIDLQPLKNVTYKADGCINNMLIILTDHTGYQTTLVNYQIPVYKVVREDKEFKLESSRPAYVYIIHKNYANVLKLRRWILSIPTARITGIKTDAIYFEQEQVLSEIGPISPYQGSPEKVPLDQPAKILREDTFKYIGTPEGTKWINGTTAIKRKAVHHYQEYTRIIPTKAPTEIIDNTKPIDLTKYTQGFHIDSMPGTGKTHLLKQLQVIHPASKTITFTNAVAHNINGSTLHKFFNQKVNDIDYNKSFKIPKILLIDECYNIPSEFYPLIAKCKARGSIIYSFGDSEQLESIDKKRMTQDEKKLFWSRMSNINLILSHNWRSNNAYVEQAKSNQINPPIVQEFKLINICKYNSSREHINTIMFQRHQYTRFVVTQNVKKENLFKGQIYELKDNFITLLYRGPATPRPFKSSMTKYIEPGYAITNHIAQGSSINEPYNIVDFSNMNQRAKFVALTRTTNPDMITTMPTLPRTKRQAKKTWKNGMYI